jgi:serine phosphatase RsbU (regulator of sigma subunit)
VQLRRKANQDGRYELFEPDAVLLYLNAEMEKLNSGKHVTLIVGLIDNAMAQLRYCVAGHLPPPILSSAGKSQYLLGGGPPIGLFATPNYTVKQVDLPLTWSISCFSDGVFELLKASSLKDCEAELLQRLKNTPQTLNTLEQELGLTKLSQVIDDVTVLNIRNFEQ